MWCTTHSIEIHPANSIIHPSHNPGLVERGILGVKYLTKEHNTMTPVIFFLAAHWADQINQSLLSCSPLGQPFSNKKFPEANETCIFTGSSVLS